MKNIFIIRIFIGLLVLLFIIFVLFTWSLAKSSLYLNSNFLVLFICQDSGGMLLNSQAEDRNKQLFLLPENLNLDVAYNLGQYKFGKIYTLGEQQEIGGGKLLLKTLRDTLSIPVDFFIYYPKSCIQKNNSQLFNINKILLNSLFSSKPKSNLAFYDKLKLLYLNIFSKRVNWALTDLSDFSKSDESGNLSIQENGPAESFLFSFNDKSFSEKNINFEVVNNGNCSEAASKSIKLLNNLGIYATYYQEEFDFTNINDRDSFLLIKSSDRKQNRKNIRLQRLLSSKVMHVPELSADYFYLLGEDFCRLSRKEYSN